MRAELRVETCGSHRGSACLAISPCANVHVIVLGADVFHVGLKPPRRFSDKRDSTRYFI